MNIKNKIMAHYTALADFPTAVGRKAVSENLDSFYEVQDFMNRMAGKNPYYVQVSKVEENGDWKSYTYILLQDEEGNDKWELVGTMSKR